MNFITWTNGKKTYITVGVGVLTGIAAAFGYHVPDYIQWAIGLTGLAFLRAGINSSIEKQTEIAVEAVLAVTKDVLGQIEVPSSPVGVGTVIPVTQDVSVVVGQPSPKTVPEHSITEALNAAQLG